MSKPVKIWISRDKGDTSGFVFVYSKKPDMNDKENYTISVSGVLVFTASVRDAKSISIKLNPGECKCFELKEVKP